MWISGKPNACSEKTRSSPHRESTRSDPPPHSAPTPRAGARARAVRRIRRLSWRCAGSRQGGDAEPRRAGPGDQVGRARHRGRARPSRGEAALSVQHAGRRLRLARRGRERSGSTRCRSRSTAQPVAHHIYSFKELEALQKGGVQRIYTGNVADGRAPARGLGRRQASGGTDFTGTRAVHASARTSSRSCVGVTLARADGLAGIQLGSW